MLYIAKCFGIYFSHHLIEFVLFFGRCMACKGPASYPEWSEEDLDKAFSLVKEDNVSIRTAALSYGIPKSTLHDHYASKVKGIVNVVHKLFCQILRNQN